MNRVEFKKGERIICFESTGYSLYDGYYIVEKFDKGKIKLERIDCSILETENRLSSVFQSDRAVSWGEGAAKVAFTDGKFVIVEKITNLLTWYKNICKSFSGRGDWVEHMTPHLIKLLR